MAEIQAARPETYSTDRVFLLPYSPSQPPFCSAEGELQDMLSYLYKRTKDDGLLDVLFTGMEPPSKDRFIHMLWPKPMVVAFLRKDDGAAPEAIGYGWLMEIEGDPGTRKANFGFTMFKQYWGTEEIRDAAKLSLRWWFEEMRCDVLFGPTLRRNLLAQHFAEEMGFRKVAEIPMFFCGSNGLETCVLVSMTKEEFRRAHGGEPNNIVEMPSAALGR